MGFLSFLKKHVFLRNLLLAVCFFIIFIALTQLILNCSTRHGQAYSVPDFNGLTLGEAKAQAKEAALKLEINDSLYLPSRPGGTVLEQNPSPGSKVKSGRRVFLTINAFNPKTAQIPYVTGYSLRQAKNNLEVAGFEIEKLVYRDDIAANNVLEQQYNGREVTSKSNIQAPTGSGITLVVGRGQGNNAVKVPKVIGFTLKDAKSRLWEVGLNIGKITRDAGITDVNQHQARVSKQSLSVGSSQSLGAVVDLNLTLDEEAVAAGNKTAEQTARRAAAEAEAAAAAAQQENAE
ncbi:PASTA domain-containing protein [Alistipes sp. OttesenSCG-928-L06]|nr:PASTA domain-containing protein [Alistipes sp. OttesenSCG-928-L06]